MTAQNARDLGARRSRRASSVRRALVVPAVAGIVLSSSVMGSAALAAEATTPAEDAGAAATAAPTRAFATPASDATAAASPAAEETSSPAAAAEPQATPSAAAETGAASPTAEATGAQAEDGAAAEVTSAPTAQASETASAAPSAAAVATTPAPSVTPGTGTTTSGASYDTASATVRPLLSFKGWRDADGALLSSSDGVPIEIALVDADGNAQTATILLKFVDGVSGYNLPLWPFTKNMDPHEGDYTIRYRVQGTEDWTDAGTVHLTVSLPSAGSDAALTSDGADVTGTGWSFDGKTNINGVFRVAVRLTDARGRTYDVDVPASFTSGTFTVSPEQLATVAPAGGVVSVQALSGTEVVGDAVTVTPTASVDGTTVTTDGRLTLEVASWRSLDGTVVAAPSLTLNALDPETGEVLRSYDLGQSVVLPASGASSYDLDVAGILARAGLEGDGTPLGTGSYSLTLTNEDGWTATTGAFTVTAGLPTGEPEPAPSPAASDHPVDPIQPVDPIAPSPADTEQPISPVDPAEPGDGGQGGAGYGRDIVVTPGEEVTPVRPATDPVPSNPGSGDAASRALRDAAEHLAEGRTPTTSAADAVAAAEAARTSRPASSPVSPVADASALTVANAGSLSGGREGNIVQLILPSSKAQKGDWVSVFLFPGGTTSGWAQVDSDNSVSIDVSALGAGTYQLAVADRDNALLGWAQLEVSGTRATTDPDAGIIAVDGTRGSLLGPSDWMLVSAGGLLMIGAASFVVLAKPARVSPRR